MLSMYDKRTNQYSARASSVLSSCGSAFCRHLALGSVDRNYLPLFQCASSWNYGVLGAVWYNCSGIRKGQLLLIQTSLSGMLGFAYA